MPRCDAFDKYDDQRHQCIEDSFTVLTGPYHDHSLCKKHSKTPVRFDVLTQYEGFVGVVAHHPAFVDAHWIRGFNPRDVIEEFKEKYEDYDWNVE